MIGGQFVELQPPETAMLEKMKNRGGEVTDRFLNSFPDAPTFEDRGKSNSSPAGYECPVLTLSV